MTEHTESWKEDSQCNLGDDSIGTETVQITFSIFRILEKIKASKFRKWFSNKQIRICKLPFCYLFNSSLVMFRHLRTPHEDENQYDYWIWTFRKQNILTCHPSINTLHALVCCVMPTMSNSWQKLMWDTIYCNPSFQYWTKSSFISTKHGLGYQDIKFHQQWRVAVCRPWFYLKSLNRTKLTYTSGAMYTVNSYHKECGENYQLNCSKWITQNQQVLRYQGSMKAPCNGLETSGR